MSALGVESLKGTYLYFVRYSMFILGSLESLYSGLAVRVN